MNFLKDLADVAIAVIVGFAASQLFSFHAPDLAKKLESHEVPVTEVHAPR